MARRISRIAGVGLYVLAFMFLMGGLQLVVLAVHQFNHATGLPRFWVSQAMHDMSPVPSVVAAVVVAFFAFDNVLRRKQSIDLDKKPRSSLTALFYVGTSIVLVFHVLFWLTDGDAWFELAYTESSTYGESAAFRLASMIALPVCLALALAAGVAKRFAFRRARWLRFVMPVAYVATIPVLAHLLYDQADMEFPPVFPFIGPVAAGVLMLGGVAALVAWYDRRTGASRRSAGDLMWYGLWALGVGANLILILPFLCLCTVLDAPQPQRTQIAGTLGVFALAVTIRFAVHWWLCRKRDDSSAGLDSLEQEQNA